MAILGSIIKKGIELRTRISSEKKNPMLEQKKELKKLLRKAQFTMFGQMYEFEAMLDAKNFIRKFRDTVPVYDYDALFSSWWNKALHDQEDVCWPGRVKYFALSSGTSGSSSKHIPVTKDMVKAIQKTSLKQIYSLSKYNLPKSLFEKGILMLGGSTHLSQKGRFFEGDLSGITASQIPFWFQHFYKPGRKISKEKDWNAKLEEITEKAPSWDIGIIVGVPAWIQLLLEKIIKRYNLQSIHEIWPNLQVYVHGGVSIEPYRKSLDKFFSKKVFFIETYLASEGFIAYQDEPENRSMKLITNNGIFFEFIPFTSEYFTSEGDLKTNRPKTLLIDEVEDHKEYAVLLSTCSGAWRYLIGDVIRFTQLEKREIVITGRTKHFLSLCGEHLSVDNMNKAIEMVAEHFNITINEFVVAGIPYENMFAHRWYIGTNDEVDVDLLTQKLDDLLCILNDDYRVERSSALKDILVKVVPTNVFISFLESKGKVGAQNKFPRVMKQEAFDEWENFVRSQNISVR
ncbi:MAG TPA: GH3 auxin-responsive promoter family protein [Bacteroidia bacterium]|nr:GH3 auxin-responsive promoter family protein [Bacteroidia bacterium]